MSAFAASAAILPAGPQAVAFPAREARFVRFVIHAASQSEPCLDELEVYGPDSPANLALASAGAKPSASSLLPGYAIHQIAHLNDGLYGNPHSWIAGAGEGWAQIELPRAAKVDRVVFSRDRGAQYQDRVPTAFEVRLSLDGERWETVARVAGPEDGQAQLDLPDVYRREATWQETLRQAGDRLLFVADELTRQDDARLREALGDAWAWFTARVRDAGWWDADTVLWVQGHRLLKDRRSVLLAEAMTGLRARLQRDFTAPDDLRSMAWEQRDRIWEGAWQPGDLAALAGRYAAAVSSARQPAAMLLARAAKDADGLAGVRELYLLDQRCRAALAELPWRFNPAAMRRAITDLSARYADRYPHGAAFLAQVDGYERRLPELRTALAGGRGEAARRALALHDQILAFQRRALVDENPVVDFDRVLLIRHRSPDTPPGVDPGTWTNGLRFGLPFNWESDFSFPGKAPWWEDRIETVSLRDPAAAPHVVWQPEPGTFVQHLDLRWDAQRMLFAMPGSNGRWQVFEVGADGQGLRQVTPGAEPDVDNGDPCYLPDGRIVFNSDRCFSGVPCINGSSYITNLCLMNPDGSGQRMLTFDQENNWHPAVLNNGRVLYTRYEYADVSHQFPGLLFHMNPDGTEQMEFYGSNSYWPNRIYFPRAVPGRPTEVVGVVCGHHGPNRNGRLVLFDPERGRTETDGVVQTIPGWGQKVEPVTQDELYGGVWPKFLHPYPLSDQYFLAAGRPNAEAGFGLWLVDVFDNLVQIRDEPGFSLCEPIPLRPRARPPVIPDKVRLERNDATVYLVDVYRGQALGGVPRGAVKSLRVLSYNYTYREKVACGYGHLSTPGIDGPWEPRRILGTVPVQTDGSAFFKVPANTPISVQPLDSNGRALQLMRSWFTAMPGEVVTCVGCHDRQSSAPQAGLTLAAARAPVQVSPWRGPARGFDFEREVQPLLDRHCAGCHGQAGGLDLARKSPEEKAAVSRRAQAAGESDLSTVFTPAYLALQPYIRRPGAESNYRRQQPGEFGADTSPLVQMLHKGHHGVRLDAEAWDRLYTWIDLGGGDHGTWTRFSPTAAPTHDRRQAMWAAYANLHVDFEALPPADGQPVPFVAPVEPQQVEPPTVPGWPFDTAEAQRRQAAAGLPERVTLPLDGAPPLELVLVPAGDYVMGGEAADEAPRRERIERPFYLGAREVSNEQLRALQPRHDSGRISWMSIDQRGDGYAANDPRQPAVRVAWDAAAAYCAELARITGQAVALPTEAQWEWACRAGSAGAHWYGGDDTDFAPFENLADRTLRQLAFPGKPKWYLRDDRSDDHGLVTAPVGSYQPNAWGLYDMGGNAAEWTQSEYAGGSDRVVRGGSWWDPPRRAHSGRRWHYPAWRRVYNVGFRVALATP